MSNPHTLADAIRAEMSRRRKTQADAAQVLGISQAAVGRRLTGEVDITVPELQALAAWLEVPASALLESSAA